MFYKLVMGANHRELYCIEPRTMVGALTALFLDEDTRGLESLKGYGKPPIIRKDTRTPRLRLLAMG